MKDHILEERQNNYRKCDFDLQNRIESRHLGLRKQAIDDIVMKSRLSTFRSAPIRFEIDQTALEIDSKLKDYTITDIYNQISEIQAFLSSDDIEYIKLGIVVLRKFLAGHPSEENQFFLMKNNIIQLILNLLKTSTDLKIVVIFLNIE